MPWNSIVIFKLKRKNNIFDNLSAPGILKSRKLIVFVDEYDFKNDVAGCGRSKKVLFH